MLNDTVLETALDAAAFGPQVAASLYPAGAYLLCARCRKCRKASQRECAEFLSSAWPLCCGETMEAVPRAVVRN